MNTDRLLAHYARIGDAPDAIARLRRFVLDLAVRGKLVEQDGTDESVLEYLRGMPDLPPKARKLLKPLHPSDCGGDVPKTWCWLPLGAIIRGMDAGWSPQCENHPRSSEDEWGVLKTTAVQALSFDAMQHKRLPEKLNSRPQYQADVGDILVTRAGPKNRVGVSCVVDVPCPKLMISDKLIRFHALGDLSARYIALTLNAGYTFDQIEAAKSGMAVMQMNISQEKLRAIPIPLPPLAEQRRIVAKVDELMALCDRLGEERGRREALRDRLTAASLARLTAPDTEAETFRSHARFTLDAFPALTTRSDQIKQLRQTILNLALRGKLVAQDPADEPASELLKRIAAEKARLVKTGQIKKQKPSAPILNEGRSFAAPSVWVWTRLIEIGVTQTGTSPSSSKPELFGDFTPFVKPADLDGATIRYDGPGLSREGKDHSRVAPANSVMMVCIGATLGKVNVTNREVCFNQQINSLTPYVDAMHGFLALALKSSDFQERAWTRAGTGTLPIISKGKWEGLPIPLPPLAEQNRIVAKVDALMALCDRLEAALATADTTRARLLEALLHEALEPVAREKEAAE